MSECTFTIFEGADTGRQFVLADRPLTIGREPGRDVLLHDERVSRHHITLTPGDEPLLADENSSNGTFINGAMVRRARLRPGDIIVVGNTKIIFGATTPQLAQIEEMKLLRQQAQAPGTVTSLLPEPVSTTPALQSVRIEQFLNDLAAMVRPDWEKAGARIHVEMNPAVERLQLDARRLLAGLAALMGEFRNIIRARPDSMEREALIALRCCPDPAYGGMVLEIICIGIDIPQRDVRQAAERGAFRAAEEAVVAHLGTLEMLPPQDEDVLARVRLPIAGSPESATVIRKPV